MENIKLYLKRDGFANRIENLENKAEALEIQESNENYIQFIDRIAEKACEINPKFNTMLEKDIYDEKWNYIRRDVADQGYGLDRLIYDENEYVRAAVARQGYKLNKLVDDKDWEVRVAVAEQGYGLDKLINDEDYRVRVAVARQGYGLDRLINDVNWRVRVAVAKQGYGLDKLINDEDWDVKNTAKEKLNNIK